MTSHERKTQVRISLKTADALRRLAASFDYFQSRGTGAHTTGNIADMLDAIVDGDLQVVRSSVRSDAPEAAENAPKARRSAKK